MRKMSLSVLWRGLLEKVTEKVIRIIPDFVTGARTGKAGLHITDENDYVYGIAIGSVIGRIHSSYIGLLMRPLSEEESNRSVTRYPFARKDIRDAIIKMG